MDVDVGGEIHGISLDSFLQMVQIEKTTCTLTVKSKDNVGYLYILEGDLIAAETGDFKNIKAACLIISWDKITIEIENACSKKENEINQPLAKILTEGLKLKDKRILKERNKRKEDVAEIALKEEKQFVPPSSTETLELVSSPVPTAVPTVPIEREEIPPRLDMPVKRKARKDVAKKLRIKRILTISAAIIVFIFMVIGAHYSIRAIKANRARKAYESALAQVENQHTLEEKIIILNNYISAHEESEFVGNARNKIKEIKKLAEELDFKEVINTVDNLPIDDDFKEKAMTAYNQYLEAYPSGIHEHEIQQRILKIADLLDDADYKKIMALAQDDVTVRLNACTRYLADHPNGKYRITVEQFISDMSEAFYDNLKKEIATCNLQKKWDNCIELCGYFISAFKGHRLWDEVVVLKNEMQAKSDLAALLEAAALAGSDYEAAKKVFRTYLEENPETPENDKILFELRKIESKIAGKKEWENVVAFSKNQAVNVFERERKLKRYITQNPSGPFVEDAKKVLKQLEAEKLTAKGDRQKETQQSIQQSRTQVNSSTPVNKEKILREREKITAQLKPIQRFTVNGDGTFTDSLTGLMWCVLDSYIELGKCMNYESAQKYVSRLRTGGYKDWRLPTSSDLAGIYKSNPFFPDSGAKWYWTSKIYVDGHHRRAGIVTSKHETVFQREYVDVEKCGAIRAVRP